ncbi:MAG: hypothetical protein BA874_06680 [Desulfuromonadales bacterium C00003068]|nr:MAG: hypothetical protein BA874_06680 [Desulfuromonadales bacterium C00003068]
MNEEELWYVVRKFSNMRQYSEDGVIIYSNYDAARESAANLSKILNRWYIPILISEYNEIYG